jgi:hypothetical protein
VFAFKHGHIGVLSKSFDTAMLDYQESRFDVLEDKTKTRNASGCAPDLQFVVDPPDTKVYFGAFDCGS